MLNVCILRFVLVFYGFNNTIICRRHLADLETRDRVTHYAFTLVSTNPLSPLQPRKTARRLPENRGRHIAQKTGKTLKT